VAACGCVRVAGGRTFGGGSLFFVVTCCDVTDAGHLVCRRAPAPHSSSILNTPSLTPELSANFTNFTVAPGMVFMPPSTATFVRYPCGESCPTPTMYCMSNATSNATGVCVGMMLAQGSLVSNCSVRGGYITDAFTILDQQYLIADYQ
jgi:hypothetical protein